MTTDPDQRLEYLYKEYVRLSEKSDELIKSSLDDLKLFGIVGSVILIWTPIYELIVSKTPKLDTNFILFLGFLILLSIVGIIGYFILLKQAYGWYFVHNLQAYEIEIKKELG